MSKREGFTFDGFEPANTTPVPDVFFDVLLPQLSGAEVKVLLYVIRRTLGFKKTTDTISLTQFEKGIITKEGKVLDQGCGLSRETINNALHSLETKGCIKSRKRNSTSGDKDTTAYSVRFKGEVVGKSDYPRWSENLTTLVGKSDYGGQENRLPVVGKSDLQETVLQDTDSQETDIQEGIAFSGENAPAHLKEEHEKLFEEVTETLIEVKTASGRLIHVPREEYERMLSDSHSQHAIRNEEDDEPTDPMPAVVGNIIPPKHTTMPSKGVTRGTGNIHHPGDDNDHAAHLGNSDLSRPAGDQNRIEATQRLQPTQPTPQQQGVSITSEQAPGTSTPPIAVTPPRDRLGASPGVQAISSRSPEPAQTPFAGSTPPLSVPPTRSASASSPAQVSGRKSRTVPERPKGGKPAVLALTFEGADVKRWIEEVRGVKVRMTENNVKACNALADTDGVSLEALRAYFEHVEEQKWTVDLLTAAGETKNQNVQFLSFESNWPKLKRKLNGKCPSKGFSAEHPPADNDYSPMAQLWRQNQARGAR